MTTRHKHADLIIAWANGAEIQWKDDAGAWHNVNTRPFWLPDVEYRIKPKTIKYRLALMKTSEPYVGAILTDHEASFAEDGHHFVRWLTDWIEVEV